MNGRSLAVNASFPAVLSALAALLVVAQPAWSAAVIEAKQAPSAVGASGAGARGAAPPVTANTGREIRGDIPETRGARCLYLFTLPDDVVRVDVVMTSPRWRSRRAGDLREESAPGRR